MTQTARPAKLGSIQLSSSAQGSLQAVLKLPADVMDSSLQTDPTRFVSGGDDGAVKLWSMRDSAAAATIDSKANVCSVQLSPENSHLLAFGSANYRVYLYDLRKARPLQSTLLTEETPRSKP